MTLIKSFVLLCFIVTCGLEGIAQNTPQFKVGGQAAIGISRINGDYAKQFEHYPFRSFGIGAIAEKHDTSNHFFGVEFNLLAQGDSTFQIWKSVVDSVATVDSLRLGQRLVYFQVPVLFGYKFPFKKNEEKYFYLKGGPYLGILWSALENRQYSSSTSTAYVGGFDHGYKTDQYSKLDFGFQFAIGVQDNSGTAIEIRLSEGISDITDSNGKLPYFNRVISLNCRFFLYQD